MITPREFTASLQRQKVRLKQKWTDDSIAKIDQQLQELRIACREERGLKRCLKAAHQNHQGEQSDSSSPGPPPAAAAGAGASSGVSSSFQKAWKPLKGRFKELREYCAGVATVMPGTSSVESDFSLINWTRDPNSASLTDFSLDAILHCKQYAKLQKLID
jgi:hypothetical protein